MIWVYRRLNLPDRRPITAVCLRRLVSGRYLSRRFLAERRFGMATFMATAEHAKAGRWHVIDADGQVLGRIATRAARLLQGKHKATYTPSIDVGDYVVVVNAAKVKLSGRKEDQKIYRQHSG